MQIRNTANTHLVENEVMTEFVSDYDLSRDKYGWLNYAQISRKQCGTDIKSIMP